jgi:ubiquinone/menaquinone biosynthesis C-methylase UbiE
MSLVRLKEGDKFLDAAAGPGIITCKIAKKYIKNKIFAFDISSPSIDFAMDLAKFHHCGNIEFKIADIESCSEILTERFDFILATEILEHLEDPRRALSELYKLETP